MQASLPPATPLGSLLAEQPTSSPSSSSGEGGLVAPRASGGAGTGIIAASVAAERPRETARAAWTAVKQKKPLRRLRRLPRAIVRGSSRAAAAGFLEATTGAARGAAAWAGAGVVGPGPVVVVVSAAAILGRGRLVAPLSALVALRIVAGGLAAGEDDDDDRGGE